MAMNGSVKKFMIAAAVSVSALLFGASDRSIFAKIKVDLQLEKPPVPTVNKLSHNPSGRVVADPQWLGVRVYYYPQGPRNNSQNQQTYLDDVRMQINLTFPLGRGDTDRLGMFKGGQTLWTVYCNGKSHMAMMFIPPQLLQRYVYMLDGDTGVHVPVRADLKAEVIFFDRSDRELGRGYCGVSGTASKQEENFAQLERRVLPACVIDGAFVERTATPWSCLAPDQFDFVKPAAVKLPDTPAPPRRRFAENENPVRGPVAPDRAPKRRGGKTKDNSGK